MITGISTNWLGQPGNNLSVTIFILECNSMFDEVKFILETFSNLGDSLAPKDLLCKRACINIIKPVCLGFSMFLHTVKNWRYV